jgi:ribonuclease HI
MALPCANMFDLQNTIKALSRPANTTPNTDIALWCDGSFDRSNHTGAASTIVIIDDEIQEKEGQCYSNSSSSYDSELLALLLGLDKNHGYSTYQ